MTSDKTKSGFVEIDASALKSGQVLASDVFDGDSLLLRAGTKITDGFLAALHKRGITRVEVSGETAGMLKSRAGEASGKDSLEAERHTLELIEESGIQLSVDPEVLEEVSDCMEDVFTRLTQGMQVDLNIIKAPVAKAISQSLSRPNAAIKLLDVKHYDFYTFGHSVNVGLLFLALCRDQFPAAEIEKLAMGAVLHDIGKTKIPLEIIRKPGPLDAHEWNLIKKHPEFGAEILEEHGGFCEEAVWIAHQHHERWDGGGYPRGLKGDETHLVGQLAAVCDVYDALTTTRSYKPKMEFHDAMSIIVQGSGTQFSPRAVRTICSTVGLYPVGTFVMLSDGSVGVVRAVNAMVLVRPEVMLLYDERKRRIAPPKRLSLESSQDLTIARQLTSAEVGAMRG
ncbi:MAG: HD-GYP domain-containing protein [bacterium]|jgi:putative nucleotidyltransferase with HDIG domain